MTVVIQTQLNTYGQLQVQDCTGERSVGQKHYIGVRVGDFLPIPFDAFRTEIVDHSADSDGYGGRLGRFHGRAVIGADGKCDRDHCEV